MITGGKINCYCPGPCPICSEVTLNMVLCDTCKQEPKPARPHPKRCQNCGNWPSDCRVECQMAREELAVA